MNCTRTIFIKGEIFCQGKHRKINALQLRTFQKASITSLIVKVKILCFIAQVRNPRVPWLYLSATIYSGSILCWVSRLDIHPVVSLVL